MNNVEDNAAEQLDAQPVVAGPPDAAAGAAEPAPNAEGMMMMDEACKREISVEIPAEVVDKQREALVHQYSKQARVPGFRKGKVPASMVRTRFSDEITNDVVEALVPKYFRDAIVKSGLKPVSQPAIQALEATPGEAIRFKAAFEVLPDFELGDYQDIKIEKPQIKVEDTEVEAEITKLQEQQASFDPVTEERGAENGEFVQVSFQAESKAESKEAGAEATTETSAEPTAKQPEAPVQMDDVLVEIGGANTIPEFTENLRGVKTGDERNFDVPYPEDFPDKRLAGQSFHYAVKVNAVKKKTLPELNDDFAKELSPEFQTLDDLKQRIRENMEAQLKHKAEHEAKEKLVQALVDKHDFSVPRAMVEHQIDLRLERGLRALAAQGMRTEDMRRMDFPRLRAAQRDAAVKEVKSSVLLARIADAENLHVSDEELESEIAALAQQMKQPLEEVKRKLAEDNAQERMRDRMRSEKALNLLYTKSD